MQLIQEQQIVLAQIQSYIRDPRPAKPYFMFQGLPGVGKTYLMAALAKLYPDAVMCAFTGKAASVLSRRTGHDGHHHP